MKFSIKTLLVTIMAISLVLAIFVSVRGKWIEYSQEARCQWDMKQLALTMHFYESVHGHFPEAVTYGPNDKPWHSWRIRILPFLEQLHTFDYDFDQPWNAAANKAWLVPDVSYFQCDSDLPSCQKNHQVSYVVVSGEGTAFPLGRAVKVEEITDGLRETIFIVESLNTGIQWAEPADLDFETMSFKVNDSGRPGISSRHAGGAIVAFGDGTILLLTDKVTPEELRAMLTISGGENVSRDELLKRGILR